MTYTREEQQKHRAELVEALRSGRYEQARKVLRDGNRFCCLGVACDISGLDEWEEYDGYLYLNSKEVMPREVMDYYGFFEKNGKHKVSYTYRKIGSDSLSFLNDRWTSFEEIANIIEREPEGMFV